MGKAWIEKKSAKKCEGAGERQGGPSLSRQRPHFSRSRASYFRVPFLIFTPSQLSESLEQAKEREETRDETKMTALLFWGAILLLLNKIGLYFPAWLIKGSIIQWRLICLFGRSFLCLFCVCFLDATFRQICDYTWLDRKWFLYGEHGPYQNASIVLVTDSFVSLTAGWVGNRNQNTPRGLSGLCARQIYRCLPLVYVGFDLHLEIQYLRRPSYPAPVCLFRSTRRNIVFVKGYLKEKNETAKM